MNNPQMDMDQAIKTFKALSDGSRLRILSSLMEAPKYVEIIAERLELAPSTVSFHLKKLEEADLVTKEKDQYYINYSINRGIFDRPLKYWINPEHHATDAESLREATYRQKVLDTFIKYHKLVSIPVQRKKRLIILEHLVDAFDVTRQYTEKEVNLIIAAYHDDFATLRRELINEKLLMRENGIYWRTQKDENPVK